MSIFYKVFILFAVSLLLMLFVGNEMNRMNDAKIEALLKEKYLDSSNDLFEDLSAGDIAALERKLETLDFQKLDPDHYRDNSTPVYTKENDFGSLKILRHEDGRYVLYLRYLDEEIAAADRAQEEDFRQQFFLNALILSDIAILIVIFLFVLRMLSPIKKVSRMLVRFSEGEYTARIKKPSNDEIGTLAETFNTMAERTQALITSRESLLRDIGHELKTPISKGKLALEMMEESEYKTIVKKAFVNLDELTSELLSLERLKSGSYELAKERFGVETLILESLSRLYIEDESKISVAIDEPFMIEGDKSYLVMALKNLIDNGLKYGTKAPVIIQAGAGRVAVKSYGAPLEKEPEYYLDVFTQGEDSRGKAGYGIGLSIVRTVLERHGFGFGYAYEEEMNVFSIRFSG